MLPDSAVTISVLLSYTLYPELVADSTQLGADSTPNLLLTSKTKIEDWHPSDELDCLY